MIETCNFEDYKRHLYYAAIEQYSRTNYGVFGQNSRNIKLNDIKTDFISLSDQIIMELNIIKKLEQKFKILYTNTPKEIKDYQTSINFYNGESKDEMMLGIEKNIIRTIEHNFDKNDLLLIYDLLTIKHFMQEYHGFHITFRLKSIPESMYVASNLNLL